MCFNVRRQNVASSGSSFWYSFNHNPWQWVVTLLLLSAVTFLVSLNSGATICHGVPHKPSQHVDSQASLSVCLVQLLPRTTPFLVIHKTAPVDEDSLGHAACRRTDTVLANFTKPNLLSKLCHCLSPSSTSSPHFTRLSVFADSHLVHYLRCKTRKPTEQRTVICDTHTCVTFSGSTESSALSFHFLSKPFPHDRWPCDHPQVVLAESLPLLHMRE